jgi:hypothetical protein
MAWLKLPGRDVAVFALSSLSFDVTIFVQKHKAEKKNAGQAELRLARPVICTLLVPRVPAAVLQTTEVVAFQLVC